MIEKVHQSHPDIKFVLFAVGFHSPDFDKLKVQIEEKKLSDTIVFVPWLSHACTMDKLKKSLFYITCSRYEGLPLSLIEAMSMSKAVVASDVVGNCDCVVDKENGRLLPLDEKMYVEAIQELLNDPSLCQQYGVQSRAMFEQKFLIDRRIGELMRTYREVRECS